jgi:LuxR family transcriptional regulator, maltose regulon positive regulatory protein
MGVRRYLLMPAMLPGGSPPHISPRILDVMRGASLMPEDPSVPQRVEQLSRSALKLLRYLLTNLSRPEIAAELSVSVNTVSTHIRSIYAKLGAAERPAAVRCARDLRLLVSAAGEYWLCRK